MAAPRIFVSSTYYDLRYVRADLDMLATQIGLDIVRFEEGSIPYHTADTLPKACCKEIENCNILLSIIGGRYGSRVNVNAFEDGRDATAEERSISVSRLEVEHAIKSGLLLFVFVESAVRAEHRTYKRNIGNREFMKNAKWASVDDIAIFEFVDYIESQPGRNPIFDFRTPREMQDIMRKQLAGLFFDLIQGEKEKKFGSHLQQLVTATENFSKLEKELREKETELQHKIATLALPEHSFYKTLQKELKLEFPLFVRDVEELKRLLTHVGFSTPMMLQELPKWNDEMFTFQNPETREYFAISKSLVADDGRLILPTAWSSRLVWRGSSIPKKF